MRSPSLETKGPRDRLVVERKAVGSSESEAPFFACNDSHTHSSLSREWITIAQNIPRLQGKQWDRVSKVPVTTLDHLIDEYGEPWSHPS